MEQQNQKRNSKEKVARTSESDDRDGIVVDEHFRTRFQFMESRLEAQENVQKDLIKRLTHMESNVGEIKTAIDGIFKILLKKNSADGREPEQGQFEAAKSFTERVSKNGTQLMETIAEEQQNGNDIEDFNKAHADAAREDVTEASGTQAKAAAVQQEGQQKWQPAQRAESDGIRTPAKTLLRETVGLNTKNYGFTHDETKSNTDSRCRGKKKRLKSKRNHVKLYSDHGDDNTSNSSASEDSRDRRRRLCRRRTIFKVLKDQEKHQNLASNVARAQPSFQHILLSSILKFSDGRNG